jgi:hypothetical protein
MSGFIKFVPRKFLDTYDNIIDYIHYAFSLNARTIDVRNNTITETTEVDPDIKESVQYYRVNEYGRPIHSASNWLNMFNKHGKIYSFFMPYTHMQCNQTVDNIMISDVNETLESQADNAAKKSIKNNLLDNNDESIEVESDGKLKLDESSQGINYNDCNFMLKVGVMERINNIGKGITVKSSDSNNKKGKIMKKKEYTIDLREIPEGRDKILFENFISIPPDLEDYVKANDKQGKRKDLPICYLVSNGNHSYLFIQTLNGNVFVIGFGPLTESTDYNNNAVIEDGESTNNIPLPGRVDGVDRYYTEASPDLNINDNWLSYVCFLDKKILENLKNMLKSTTLIKFTTVNDNLTGSVSICFFKSTAKEPKSDNNYSYSYKHNCLGWVQRMLGIEIPVTEGNPIKIGRDSGITRTSHENVPYLLNSLSPQAIKAIEDAHRTGGSKALYDVIKNIQEGETPYGIQSFFSEEQPDPLIKRFTMQNIRELFLSKNAESINNFIKFINNPNNTAIIEQLNKIFTIDQNNNIIFNPNVNDYKFTKEELRQIFTSNELNKIFLFKPDVLREIFSLENKSMKEEVKEIFGPENYAAIFPSVSNKRKRGGKRTKAKSKRNKPKKKTLRRRKN